MPKTVVSGVLVGGEVYSYNSFTDSAGRTVEGGTAHAVFVGSSLSDPPVRVKVSSDQFEELTAAGFGAAVEMHCTPFPKGRRIEYRCDSFEAR